MSVITLNNEDLRAVKRQAKFRARQNPALSYMQHLDIVAREMLGVRHFHEARKRVDRAPAQDYHSSTPWMLYLQACQESYFDI